MSSSVLFLSEEDVKQTLDWDSLFAGIKQIMADLSLRNSRPESLVIQPPRLIMPIPHKKGSLLLMPGYSERKNFCCCKLVSFFTDNTPKHGLPTIMANILLLDSDTGKLKAILEGTTITGWRTAASSAVAAQVLKPDAGKNQTLAVFGAGEQGKLHIIAFQHFFKFSKVKLWNRTHERGVALVDELKKSHNINVELCSSPEECAKDADVIVTATYASEPYLKYKMIKKGVTICAVGAGRYHYNELDMDLYAKSSIYTDSMENANNELKGLMEAGNPILGEIGELINGQKSVVRNDAVIFHSLGMALEDGVATEIVLEKYLKNKKK